MFVMWQEVVVTSGRGGCCQMMAPGGTMCEMKVGLGGGGRGEEETRERRRGEEERSLTQQTAPPPPFPSLPSQSAVLQLLVDIDPGGAVSGGAAWKVSALGAGAGAGEAQPPGPPPLPVPQALRGLAITLEPLKQTLPLSRLSLPLPRPLPRQPHTRMQCYPRALL